MAQPRPLHPPSRQADRPTYPHITDTANMHGSAATLHFPKNGSMSDSLDLIKAWLGCGCPMREVDLCFLCRRC